jgi:hypothetical protein
VEGRSFLGGIWECDRFLGCGNAIILGGIWESSVST